MWGSLIGWNIPFIILLLASFASLVCSFVISHDVDYGFHSTNHLSRKSPNHVKSQSNVVQKYSQQTEFSIPLGSDFVTSMGKVNLQNILSNQFNNFSPPPTSLEDLRKKYGTRSTIWGDWSSSQTRSFYKAQLPNFLQSDGALGLNLEERAKMASEARHALRMYSRERCRLPGRMMAQLFDGIRHIHEFGSWSPTGMSWEDIKRKYTAELRQIYPKGQLSPEQELLLVYQRVLMKSCSTNALFDSIAGKDFFTQFVQILSNVLKLKDKQHYWEGAEMCEVDSITASALAAAGNPEDIVSSAANAVTSVVSASMGAAVEEASTVSWMKRWIPTKPVDAEAMLAPLQSGFRRAVASTLLGTRRISSVLQKHSMVIPNVCTSIANQLVSSFSPGNSLGSAAEMLSEGGPMFMCMLHLQ